MTVLNTSGTNYDGTAYSNIKFTSSGTGSTQIWSGASEVKLSATEGYCYAYYPYNSSVTNITSVPVSTNAQTDYLYAAAANVNDKTTTATLSMKHALSAIRFALVQGTYSGTGAITAVSVTSSGLGTSATLNALDGNLSTVSGKGTAISVSKSLSLSKTVQNVDVIVVPSGSAGTIILIVTIDGKEYSTTVTATTIAQATCYTYNLTVNAGALSLSGVQIGAWGYNTEGSPTISAAGHSVTIAGNYADIAFINTVNGNSVTIQAMNKDGYPVKAVTITGTATLTQSVSGSIRTITLSGIGSAITVNFNGYTSPPAAVSNTWGTIEDGVYAVRPDLKPAALSAANEACIGVGVINSSTGYHFMIEKFEYANRSYQGQNSFFWGYHGKKMSEILPASNYPSYANEI